LPAGCKGTPVRAKTLRGLGSDPDGRLSGGMHLVAKLQQMLTQIVF
jgi:hypothetical protein